MLTPHTALRDLLADAFAPDELDRLILALPGADHWRAELPTGSASRADHAARIATFLADRGRLDAHLYAALRHARPGRVAEIDALAARFSARTATPALPGVEPANVESAASRPTERSPNAPPSQVETDLVFEGDLGGDPLARRDQVLQRFYDLKPAAEGTTGAYAYQWSGATVLVPVATRPEWLGWRLPVQMGDQRIPDLDIACGVQEPPAPDNRDAETFFRSHLDRLKVLGKRMSPDPQCRLLEAGPRRLRFGPGRYDAWRERGTGLLEDELAVALLRGAREPAVQTCERLSWRRRMMPDLDAVTRLEQRVCLGGVQVVTVWRKRRFAPWNILYSQRSMKQGDNPGAFQCLPRGFHEPPRSRGVPSWTFCGELSRSVAREFGEELLGVPILGDLENFSAHLHALERVEEALSGPHARVWLNGLVFSLDNGNYELLFTVMLDEHAGAVLEQLKADLTSGLGAQKPKGSFWELNWEASGDGGQEHGPRLFQIRPENLAHGLSPEHLCEWVPGSRVALIETLTLLRDVDGVELGGELVRI